MLVAMENYYLVAKELSDMSKKFKTEISQNWLVTCVAYEVVMGMTNSFTCVCTHAVGGKCSKLTSLTP